MSKATKELVATIVMDDRLAYRRAKARHPVGQPGLHPAAMQRKIRTSPAPRHDFPSIDCSLNVLTWIDNAS
jgi:hypothetical protein